MIKIIFLGIIFSALPALVLSGPASFVYKDKETVLSGKPWIGVTTQDGVVVTLDVDFSPKGDYYVGDDNGNLFKGSVGRLDMDLNVVLIKKGEKITEDSLFAAHQRRALSFQSFLPTQTEANISGPGVTTPATPILSGDPFLIKINDQSYDGSPIELPVKRRKSKIKVAVVNVSTSPLWRVEMKMKADPKLSFWKKGRSRSGLNDVPRPVFRYSYQAMFRQLKTDDSFSVPVEIHYIKKDAYDLTVTLKSKIGELVRTIPIRFKKS